MAWIERRGKKWLVRWREDDVIHSKSCSTRDDARIKKADVEKAQLQGTMAAADVRKQPLGDYIGVMIDADLSLRRTTRDQYRGALRNHVEPRLGRIPLEEVQPARVRAALAQLHEEEGAWTTTLVHRLLTRTFRQALEEGAIVRSPMVGLRPPKRLRREIRILTPEEVSAVADAIDPRYRVPVLLAAWGGLRIGEIGALRRSDVDFGRGTVSVRQALSGQGSTLEIGPPKTRSSYRTVTMPAWVMHELAEHLLRYTGDSEMIFRTERGNLVSHISIQRPFARACEAAGLKARFHDLRHTAVSILIAQGAHPKLIQARVGHASITMTMDRYGHLFPTTDAELAAGLERFKPEEGKVIEL